MIVLENISKSFVTKNGTVDAVKNVSFNVKKGEIHGVIGHSGAGKSTLIRCVNLLERPSSGEVYINDVEITSLPLPKLRESRQNIGMIFQGFNLLKTATVYDNIAIPLKLLGLNQDEVNERTVKYLEIVGLADRHHAYPSQLSGGQKQRVAIARAIAKEPEILLSDEATSALDPETTDSILELLLKINKEFGITILLITHEMNVIQKICDYVYVMEDGQVIEQGHTIDLFRNPKHEITNKFLNTISQRKLAPTLIEQLKVTGSVARLTFVGASAGEPILADTAVKFNIKPNILAANIIELKNGVIGILVVHLNGEESNRKRALQFLIENGVEVKELGVNNE